MISTADVERSGNRTWPALDEFDYDGWLLRAAGGFTRRANSITVYRTSSLPLGDKLGVCEAWYQRRRLPTVFRTTPLTDPAVLAELDHRAYDDVDGAIVMSMEIPERAGDGRGVTGVPSDEWWTVFAQDRDIEPHRDTLEHLWNRQALPIGFAIGRRSGEAVAIGTGVVDGRFLAIFNMRTQPDMRRQGHAWEVLDSLIRWARSQHASHAYLQVAPANTPAINLYMRYGFTWLYDYRYRTQPGSNAL